MVCHKNHLKLIKSHEKSIVCQEKKSWYNILKQDSIYKKNTKNAIV